MQGQVIIIIIIIISTIYSAPITKCTKVHYTVTTLGYIKQYKT